MLSAAIIVFRETFEAALIIGIIGAATRALPSRNFWLISGIGAGVAGSAIVATLTGQIAELAEGAGQELFNASVLGVAAIMLAWHNIWMARHGAKLARNAKRLGHAVVSGSREMSELGVVVALSVLREGSETALFLYGLVTGGEDNALTVAAGGALGPLVGILAGYCLYAGLLRIPARLVFAATNGFIVLLSASLASQAARFLVQADLLPSFADPASAIIERFSSC